MLFPHVYIVLTSFPLYHKNYSKFSGKCNVSDRYNQKSIATKSQCEYNDTRVKRLDMAGDPPVYLSKGIFRGKTG